MLIELVEDRVSSSENIRELYGRVVVDFYANGGETVLDVANPEGNYSLYMMDGFKTPLKNAIKAGANYECLNPANSSRSNSLGINFTGADGLDVGQVNTLISRLGTSSNFYMVVMGLAQILTYGSRERLAEMNVDCETPRQRNERMIELFVERVTEMEVSYLMVSDGIKQSGTIDRQNIPEDQVQLMEEHFNREGWKTDMIAFNGNFVLVAER